jgi:hypothetical protein
MVRNPVQKRIDAPGYGRWLTLIIPAVLLLSCVSPSDIDVPRIVQPTPTDPQVDDPRFDTLAAVIDATIRFEAQIDTSRIRFDDFRLNSLRVALLVLYPDSAVPTVTRTLYSIPASYLDLPAVVLPLRMQIPAAYFKRYTNARIATAVVVLFEDIDADGMYGDGERIFGLSEQQLFAFAEGKLLKNIPPAWCSGVHSGPNVLVRTSQTSFPGFIAAPDYPSTIFILYVRGPLYHYNVPFPWPLQGFPRL